MEEIFTSSIQKIIGPRKWDLLQTEDSISGKIIMRFKYKNSIGKWITIDRDITGIHDKIELIKKFSDILVEIKLSLER